MFQRGTLELLSLAFHGHFAETVETPWTLARLGKRHALQETIVERLPKQNVATATRQKLEHLQNP